MALHLVWWVGSALPHRVNSRGYRGFLSRCHQTLIVAVRSLGRRFDSHERRARTGYSKNVSVIFHDFPRLVLALSTASVSSCASFSARFVAAMANCVYRPCRLASFGSIQSAGEKSFTRQPICIGRQSRERVNKYTQSFEYTSTTYGTTGPNHIHQHGMGVKYFVLQGTNLFLRQI